MGATRGLALLAIVAVGCSEPDNGGGACPALTKPRSGGVTHRTLGSDEVTETWLAADSPHVVSYRTVMYSELTIEPCAYVLVEHGADFTVAREGKLVAVGTEDAPIVFDREDPDQRWGQISTSYQESNGEPQDMTGGRVELAYVTLNGGGGSGSSDASAVIQIRGNDYNNNDLELVGHLKVDHVTIDGGSVGVSMVTSGAFTAGSQALTIKNVDYTPIETSFRLLGGLPVGGTYTGNAIDVIRLRPGTPLTRDMTIRDVGVPYAMGNDFDPDDFIVDGATLTIEAGTTLAFAEYMSLQIYGTGALVARGEAGKPITFTSNQDAPAAGDWTGIMFYGRPAAANVIDGVVVEYAGGENDVIGERCVVGADDQQRPGYGAISFDTAPTTAFIKNTTLRSSLHDGFNRGWKGGVLDLSPTNTFASIAGCKQSFPVPTNGTCPATVPCD